MKTHQPRTRTSPAPRSAVLERVNASVAGIDCGATHHYVAVPVDRAPMPVQSFPTVTSGLRRLVEWLVACQITSVAIAYASHCTSFGRCETFSSAVRLFDNLTPLAFSGGSGPGSSYRYSSLSLQR
jgi:hypothetical protein